MVDVGESAEDFLEKELAKGEFTSLEELDAALANIATALDSKKHALHEELAAVQRDARSSLEENSIERLRDQLHVSRTQTMHISLEDAHQKVESSTEEFSTVCTRLSQLHRAKENSGHLLQTLMQLQQLNSNDSDIDLDAEQIILIRSALEEVNLPIYATVGRTQAQRLVEVKFNLKKNELIETFKSALALGDLEGLAKTYDIMRQFDLDEEARHIYITKLTEPVQL